MVHLDSPTNVPGDEAAPPASLVAIVSSNSARRRAWGEALRRRFRTVEVARAGALPTMLPRMRPTVLLLDRSGRGGIDPSGISAVRQLSPGSRILTALERSDAQVELRLILSGVRGCCLTAIDAPLLRKAVEAVARGQYWVRRSVLEAALESLVSVGVLCQDDALARDFTRMLDLLTPRQREIVRLVGGGGSNKEIASRLSLSEKTVKAHLTSAFQKLGIPDRLRLALLVNRPPSSYVPLPFTQAARDPRRLSYWLKR